MDALDTIKWRTIQSKNEISCVRCHNKFDLLKAFVKVKYILLTLLKGFLFPRRGRVIKN